MANGDEANTRPEIADHRTHRVLFVLGVGVAFAVLPYLSGLLGAVMLYVCLAPIHRRLRKRVTERGSAIVLTIGTLLLVLLPGSWLLSTAAREASDALRALLASDFSRRLAEFQIDGLDAGQAIAGATAALLSWLSGQAFALIGSATRATLNALVALFGLYYLFVGGDALWPRWRNMVPLPRPVADLLATRFVQVTEAMLLGILLTAASQGLIVGVGFALVGLPGAVLWGVVTACVSFLPIIGTASVWLPGTIALVLDDRYGAALILAIVGAVFASNVDNLIRLTVYRRVSGIHPMVTLVGALAGAGVFGLPGLLIGPLVLSYFFELLRIDQATLPNTDGLNLAPAPQITQPSHDTLVGG